MSWLYLTTPWTWLEKLELFLQWDAYLELIRYDTFSVSSCVSSCLESSSLDHFQLSIFSPPPYFSLWPLYYHPYPLISAESQSHLISILHSSPTAPLPPLYFLYILPDIQSLHIKVVIYHVTYGASGLIIHLVLHHAASIGNVCICITSYWRLPYLPYCPKRFLIFCVFGFF